jgi:bifunctional polynucleotide phosphatase/kinase
MPSDNTNADPETRAYWVQLAKKLNVPIRCVLFTASAKLCEHNDAVRAHNAHAEGVSFMPLQPYPYDSPVPASTWRWLTCGQLNPEKRAMLPKVAFTSFAGRYREPTTKEGFEDITKVDFAVSYSYCRQELVSKSLILATV